MSRKLGCDKGDPGSNPGDVAQFSAQHLSVLGYSRLVNTQYGTSVNDIISVKRSWDSALDLGGGAGKVEMGYLGDPKKNGTFFGGKMVQLIWQHWYLLRGP